MKELDLGLTKGLLNSVSGVLKDASKVQAEQATKANEQLNAKFKMPRPLSMEEAKVASYAAKAPERRVTDTIAALYTKSVTENAARQQAEADAIKNAYAARGGVQPVTEAMEMPNRIADQKTNNKIKELSPKQKKMAALAGHPKKIDAFDLATLRARKTAAQTGDVSDETILDGEQIAEYNERTGSGSLKMGGERTTYTRTPAATTPARKANNSTKTNSSTETNKDVAKPPKHQIVKHLSGTDLDPRVPKPKRIQELKDTPGNSAHQCAIHVKHASLGEGRTLFSQHAEPDAEGQIAWYDVMFAEGIEKKVPTTDLEILVSESHMDHKPMKKKK